MANNRIHKILHGQPGIANIWLDKYDEIFSDFDPSPYVTRSISDDFINESKKICREKEKVLTEFNLFLPGDIRNQQDEQLILKRLHNYFGKKLQQYNLEYKSLKNRGILLLLSGIVLLTILTFLLSLEIFSGLLKTVIIVFEPGGWFLIWIGLDYIFFENKSNKSDREFYKKIAKAVIKFHTIPQ